ncbi:MAG: T9SS type A sorting domain-containing protein, partial [Candidatus Zixiibacteriota bacterium]
AGKARGKKEERQLVIGKGMKTMNQMIKASLMSALFITVTASGAYTYSGVVTVDTVQVEPGGKIGIPIRLNSNDMAVSGMIIPLQFSNSLLTVDSVSFAGSLLPTDFDSYVRINNAYRRVTISYLPKLINPVPAMSASDGLLATIHVSVSAQASPGTVITLDSLNVDTVAGDGGPAVNLWERVHACGSSGQSVVLPGFKEGAVHVKSATGVDDPTVLPMSFSLAQNYPNPFNPSTTIEFTLPRTGRARLEVFNILGQQVAALLDRRLNAGAYQVEFEASGLPSGIYFYRLTHESGSLTRKMTMIK